MGGSDRPGQGYITRPGSVRPLVGLMQPYKLIIQQSGSCVCMWLPLGLAFSAVLQHWCIFPALLLSFLCVMLLGIVYLSIC